MTLVIFKTVRYVMLAYKANRARCVIRRTSTAMRVTHGTVV